MKRPMCYVAVGFLGMLILLLSILDYVPKDYNALPMLQDSEHVCVIGEVESVSVKDSKYIYTLSSASFLDNSIDKSFFQSQLYTQNKILETSEPQKYGLKLYVPAENVRNRVVGCGSTIFCKGTFYHFDLPDNEGGFNSRQYYYIRGIHGYIVDGTILSFSPPPKSLKKVLYYVREQMAQVYEDYLGAEQGAVLKAMLLGDKSELSSELKTLYQNAGISHVLSLSGLHVASIAFALLKLLRKMPYHRYTEPVTALLITLLLFFYCIMTGMAVSTVRAFIMFALGLIASLCNRTYDLLSAASFSSMVALAMNPLFLYDPGFQLSFAAVIAIALIWPNMKELLPPLLYAQDISLPFRCLRPILESILMSISIMLGTLPLSLWHFYQIPIMGVILNIIVVPLMSLLLYAGMILGVMGCLFPAATKLLSFVAIFPRMILQLYEKLCMACISIPNSVIIAGRPAIWRAILYFLALGVALYIGKITLAKKICLRVRIVVTALTVVLLFALLCVRPNERLTIRNLSVGQGDCGIITTDGITIMVDCGSSNREAIGQYCLLPCLKYNGIGKIDTIFVSHFDSDHVNGILELLEDELYKKRIGRIVISETAHLGYYVNQQAKNIGKMSHEAEDEHSYVNQIDSGGNYMNYVNLIELAKMHDIPVYEMQSGEKTEMGELEIRCMSPSSNLEYADINDASLVLLLKDKKNGFRGLFTGDISSVCEEVILKQVPRVDYLKVAHHGSRFSTGDDFAAAAQPRVSVISVGEGNFYGHPHEETLKRLENVGTHIHRTDKCGEVIIKVASDGGIKVMTFK